MRDALHIGFAPDIERLYRMTSEGIAIEENS